MKKLKTMAQLSLFLTALGNVASAADNAHELHSHVKNAAELNEVVNSPTMSAATLFCQKHVHELYKVQKQLPPKDFVKLNAHCIAGNFQKVAEETGNNVVDKVSTGQLEFANGVTKNISKDEENAINAFHKLKK